MPSSCASIRTDERRAADRLRARPCYRKRVSDADHGRAQRLARVWSAVLAARRLADPSDPLGREARQRLPGASGLSPQGVELALGRHLETGPEPRHLAQLVEASGQAPCCHVVLAANVCTAPLRALCCALATAPAVRLRPSRRDPVVAELLVRALAGSADLRQAGGELRLASALEPRPGDEVHLYGSDESLGQIRASLPPRVRVRAHGTGLGLALVAQDADLDAAAAAVTADVLPFDQRGCLSPRWVLVEGDASRAAALAPRLAAALRAQGAVVPRGALEPADRTALGRFRDAICTVGSWWDGPNHAVAFDPSPRALLLGPAVRCLQVVPARADDAARLLAPWTRFVVALGGVDEPPPPGSLAFAIRQLAPRARASPLGTMQRPPLDGPVDLRADATR